MSNGPLNAVPSFDQLMWPTLRALKVMGGSATNEELLAKIIELEALPPQVQSVPHSDNRRTKLEYNLAWAKTYLKKRGAIDNSSRGVWALTKHGEQLTQDDVVAIPVEVRKQASNDQQERQAPQAGLDSEETEVTELPWKNQLLAILQKLPPATFERLAQRLLREAGFMKVQVTGKTGDGGIDGIGVLRINLLSSQVLFQCKRYQGSVGAGAIRDFRGAMVGRSDKGLLITTGTFTPDAKREATRDGAPAIDLIDGDQLCDLLKQLNLGVRTETVEKAIFEPCWFDAL